MLRQGGKSTQMVVGGRRKVHTTFEDGGELVEEYDARTDELVLRKRRGVSALGKPSEWEYLVGDEPKAFNPETTVMQASAANPQFSRTDTSRDFCWRVRNLPYPPDTYSVTIDAADRKIVIRTSNKKYYKRIAIPELDVLELPLDPASLQWAHANNTLVVGYRKPSQVLEAEAKERNERSQLAREASPAEGDVDCKQQ